MAWMYGNASSLRRTACIVAGVALLTLAGCGGDDTDALVDSGVDGSPDTGAPPPDGGADRDARMEEAGKRDAGEDARPHDGGRDVGMMEDGETDSSVLDGGGNDGSPIDGSVIDGGAVDGGGVDGGPLDSGESDGGVLDGANALDGATALDGASPEGSALDGATADGSVLDSGESDGGVLDGASTDGIASDGSGVDAIGADGSASSGFPVGTLCNVDTDCASQLCKPVVVGLGPVCVTACQQQTDCVPSAGYFCEPIVAGSADGYCIPQSPAHCLSCAQDSECGSLSEVCFQAPGDNALACNIDCSLAGAAACPADYSCVAETVNGQARSLCRPTAGPTCADALGGFCDRVTTPEACARANAAGTCTGQRVCLASSNRYDTCGALSPECKTDCSMQDPAGCTESFCPAAESTPVDCGMCGTVCPGYQATGDNVTCQNDMTCTFSCQGENYDVDGNAANGCESPDAPQGNHTQSSVSNEGDVSDCDSPFSFGGILVSDKRLHENPTIIGFDPASGSAPDWYSIFGVGHTFCQNDIVLTLAVQGSTSPTCYHLTVITDKNTYSCQTDATGSCGFDDLNDQFSDNTTIDIEISKTCSVSVTEDVSYTVSGHL